MELAILKQIKQASEPDQPIFLDGGEEVSQIEAQVFELDEYRRRRVGREAIKISADELGYNDALTYLYRYLEDDDVDLMPDYESEIAERLKESNHFENHVFFEPIDNDFVSLKDKVSLTKMTDKSLPFLKEESAKNPKLKDEYERAKLESREIEIISEWFKVAGEGDFLIFESLPLMKGEEFAVTRIYQRVGNILEGCYFSLNNPDVAQFNKLRKKLGVQTDCHTAFEVLSKPYEINNPQFATTSDLVDYYVGTYDHLLAQQNQKNYSFGLETPEGSQNQNSLEMVKSQKGLLAVFTKTVEMLAESKGGVTPELFRICEDFGINGLHEGQPISSSSAREILKAVSLGVVSSIDKIDQETLRDLESPNCGYDASYDTAVYSSNQASANGDTYDALCPTFGASSSQSVGQSGTEFGAILQAYGVHDELGNFGQPKIGVCRINNCPSRGNSKYVHKNTLVGGCEICVHCHKIFEKGGSPEKLYDEEKKKREVAEKKGVEEEARKIAKKEELETKKVQKTIKDREERVYSITKQKGFFQQLEDIGKRAA